MAKRSVKAPEPEQDEPVQEMTAEEIAAAEAERAAERERRMAPYRAVHEQQCEQDDLLAELLYRETLRELEE